MKVALDVSALPPRLAGAGRYVAELAARLPEVCDLSLVARRNDATRWASLSSAPVSPLVASHRVARLADEAFHLGWSAPARHADLWHAPHYTMPRLRVRPTVVTIHDLTFFTNPEWHEPSKVAFFRRAIRYAASHADALICVSDFTARELSEHVTTSAPVIVAPHGVDFDRFRPEGLRDSELLAEAGLNDRPFVLFVGTFEPRKGLDVLLHAFDAFAATHPDHELWIAGQAGWGMSETESVLAGHRYASRIRRLGFVADEVLPALYRRADVVAYPSRGEGFGLPVLEALACGAAVVTTSGTVMAEVAGTAADLVPVGDADALAEALARAVASALSERSERASRALVQASDFTWERSIAQHLVAYNAARMDR